MRTTTTAAEELEPEFLTVDEVALLLRLKPKGIYSMISARRIPFIRVSNRVRFRRTDLERWLKNRQVAALAG
jgi:excisionase family DNA binding protein